MTVTSAVGHFRIAMLHKGFFIFLLALFFTNEINEPKTYTTIPARSRMPLRRIHLLICLAQHNYALRVTQNMQVCRKTKSMNMTMNATFVRFKKLFKWLLHVHCSSFVN